MRRPHTGLAESRENACILKTDQGWTTIIAREVEEATVACSAPTLPSRPLSYCPPPHCFWPVPVALGTWGVAWGLKVKDIEVVGGPPVLSPSHFAGPPAPSVFAYHVLCAATSASKW